MTEEIKGHLFNLIIYTSEKRRSDYFEKMVHSLVKRFPSRLIQIRRDQAQSNGRIVIPYSPDTLAVVPFILLPQLVPDLPIYLLWGDDPTAENLILPKLEKLATRLIFDAESTTNLQSFAKKMLNKVETLNIEFMDISWAEIAGWRDVISQVFHSTDQLNYLKGCSNIHIKYNQLQDEYIKHDSVQAIYLQGWLAAQLEWTFNQIEEIDGEHHITYEGKKVILSPQARPTLNPGLIFEISCMDDSGLKTTMTFADRQSKVMVYISTQDRCEVPYSLQLQAMQSGATAMKEMFYFRPSHHYRNMLSAIAEIPWESF